MTVNMGTVNLETPRLRLRRFVMDDADAIYHGWATDVRCTRYLSQTPHKDMDDTLMRLSFWIDEYEDGAFNWAIERKEDGKLIGNIKTEKVDKRNLYCELGYCLNFDSHGKGYATEALAAVLNYLLTDCHFHKISAHHQKNNPASGRVMQKAGMTYEATLRERIYDKTLNIFDNLIIYSIENNSTSLSNKT